MPLRNGLTKAKSFSKRYSYNDKEKLVVKMRSSSVVSSMMARGRGPDRASRIDRIVKQAGAELGQAQFLSCGATSINTLVCMSVCLFVTDFSMM